MGGAGGRPTEDYVWGEIQTALADTAASDAALDEAPVTAGKAPPFFYVLFNADGARLVCCVPKHSLIRAMV